MGHIHLLLKCFGNMQEFAQVLEPCILPELYLKMRLTTRSLEYCLLFEIILFVPNAITL